MDHWWNDNYKKTREFGENPPQIPHGLTWSPTCAHSVTDCRLTSSVMAWSMCH